jgi:hypothetical protein
VTVWTSGDAIVAAGHRLLGTPENEAVHAIPYAGVAALMVTVALYGHATIVAMQKVVVPVVGALMILGVYAFADGFNPGASSGEYMLGGSWQTWALSAVLFAAAPISYGPGAAHPGHWLPGMGPLGGPILIGRCRSPWGRVRCCAHPARSWMVPGAVWIRRSSAIQLLHRFDQLRVVRLEAAGEPGVLQRVVVHQD